MYTMYVQMYSVSVYIYTMYVQMCSVYVQCVHVVSVHAYTHCTHCIVHNVLMHAGRLLVSGNARTEGCVNTEKRNRRHDKRVGRTRVIMSIEVPQILWVITEFTRKYVAECGEDTLCQFISATTIGGALHGIILQALLMNLTSCLRMVCRVCRRVMVDTGELW